MNHILFVYIKGFAIGVSIMTLPMIGLIVWAKRDEAAKIKLQLEKDRRDSERWRRLREVDRWYERGASNE